MTSRLRSNLIPALATALLSVATMALLRLWVAREYQLSIGYGVPIVLVGWFGRRSLLWATAVALSIITLVKISILPLNDAGQLSTRMSAFLVLADLAVVAAVTDLWIMGTRRSALHLEQLEAANSELAAREEEIARQNEELQSQTEELERQSEELRLANAELAHRQRSLEVLLSLSRSLTVDLSRGEVLSRICETLKLLMADQDAAAAILEQDGNELHVRCHHGFGPSGIRDARLAVNTSFAALVLSRGRTGYLEDLSLRPDVQIPQPRKDEPFRSVLAVPLRVAGWPVGTLECYIRGATQWSEEQVMLVESLASQASVSLEAAQLFEQVDHERSRFEAVLRTVPLAVTVCGADGSDIRVNAAGAKLFNLPVDTDVSADLQRGAVRLVRNGVDLPLSEFPSVVAARHGRELLRQEFELLTGDGRRLTLLCNARPTRDPDGQITGAVAAYVDITPQKELQRELDQRRREAEEASVRKTRFLAAVSHDIRTPANAIGLLAELTRRTAATPSMVGDVPELAREMHACATSLVNLLGDVLDIARFDSGRVELQESEFSLNELLNEEATTLLRLARDKSLSLQWSCDEPIRIRADRIKLARIMGNLVGNAIKFSETGIILMAGRRDARGAVVISVTDQGIGIPREHLQHIFDEFFQMRNPERDRSKGTGLGLTICKRLVDAMGGELTVESVPGQGSRFTVTLPVHLAERQTSPNQ